jgi:hypothetical protein
MLGITIGRTMPEMPRQGMYIPVIGTEASIVAMIHMLAVSEVKHMQEEGHIPKLTFHNGGHDAVIRIGESGLSVWHASLDYGPQTDFEEVYGDWRCESAEPA